MASTYIKLPPSGAGAGTVTSVYGRIGDVVAANGDYTADQVTNTPAGNVASTTVQAAINELDTEKLAVANNLSDVASKASTRVNLNIDALTEVSNANYTILTSDKHITQKGTMSAVRTWTLPAISTYVGTGKELILLDESGTLSATNYINVVCSGTDTFSDGTTSMTLKSPGALRQLMPNKTTGKWSYDRGSVRTSNNLSDLSSAATARTNLGVGASTDVQVFTVSGTWTKPTDAKHVYVFLMGGGAGGGSGRKGLATTVRCGGGGGGGCGVTESTFTASDLPSTVTVTVGSGGNGGAAVTANSTDGNVGTSGGQSVFTGFMKSGAATGGAGGTATAGGGGVAGAGVKSTGGTGGAANTSGSTGGAGGTNNWCSSGGGAGGGISAIDGVANGGAGGAQATFLSAGLVGGTFGAAPGGAGGAGASEPASKLATGGGGGGASKTGNAGDGGAGGIYGGGGGGGGAALDSTGNSGKGGNGAQGVVVVVTYF